MLNKNNRRQITQQAKELVGNSVNSSQPLVRESALGTEISRVSVESSHNRRIR